MADPHDGTLAQLLKRLRRSARLTQEELAEAACISVRAVSDLERGINRTARKDTVRLLSDALGLSGSARELFETVALGHARAAGQEPDQPGWRLPVPPTPLIGRTADIDVCCDLLTATEARLVTITGLGGVGKTRTALAVAHRLAQRFPDGVRFVDLSALQDPQFVIATIARAAGIHESGAQTLQAQVEDTLAPLRVLFLLDNFEQVVEAAPVVSRLLTACPEVKFLVTSRRPLRVNGEQEYPLAPLGLPPAADSGPDDVLRAPSAQLLTDRIRAVIPGWRMSEGDAAAIAGICRRLDGLPLALELAASRAKVLAPAALLARLDERADLLSLGSRGAEERHRTLRATLDWSYRLLDPPAARLLPQLSAFADGRAGVGRAAEGMARACAELGEPTSAAWLLGYAEMLRERVGEPPSTDDQETRARAMTAIASSLSPDAIAVALAEGRAASTGELTSRIKAEGARFRSSAGR